MVRTRIHIWFGPAALAGRESNWIQTVPAKGLDRAQNAVCIASRLIRPTRTQTPAKSVSNHPQAKDLVYFPKWVRSLSFSVQTYSDRSLSGISRSGVWTVNGRV